MGIYQEYAAVYDASGQISFSLRMVPYLQQLLERHPVEGKTLLELACGTGTVAIAFADAGWRVYGVDGSAEMLAQARAKVEAMDGPPAGRVPIWSQQDMRRFELPERVHLATCLYDSLNYMLTSDDLLAAFRSVYRALLPGGVFLFDMNTAWALATQWDDETMVIDTQDLTIIFQSTYDATRQRVSLIATIFQRVGELYHKIVEHHVEQAYPEEHIATLLTDAGFRVEASYHCFRTTPPTASTGRIMWVARKP
ncbi:MAG TPA: class I SAM-dependent methyltransferase [Chloroflexi bacterium]|jgi:ubiquinone/menaquinone biosynthesis C-methylase UbiE|nr:class I SAM-dependent methyltransferase [Chloroflexota bacterium]